MEKTLYCKDNAGNVLIWEIKIINKNETCSLAINRGRLGGAMQLNWEHNIVPLNVGKSNETTAYEQAESRLKSRVKKKKRSGYVELTDEQLEKIQDVDLVQTTMYLKKVLPNERLDLDGFAKPMKASQYFRSKKNWVDPYGKLWSDRKYFYIANPYEPKEPKSIVANFPMMIQPKINGVRAFLYLDNGEARLKSKDGLIYKAPNHITDFANMNIDMFGEDGDIIFDGELYINGEQLQDIQGAVKSYNMNTPRVKFILFDLAIPDVSNIDRWKLLKEIYSKIYTLDTPLETVRTFMINSDEYAQVHTDNFIEQGYEGSILRNPKSEYAFGSRKVNMLKLKRCISMDFDIVRIVTQAKRPDLGMFECVYKGNEFVVNPTFSEEDKAKLLLTPSYYIGKKLQTRFYEWSNDNKPMHVIETVVRDYETP